MAKSVEETSYWQQCWRNAYNNVPIIHPRYGKARTLRILLGYPVKAISSCNQHYNQAASKGDRPRCPNRRHLLQMMGGPDGKTLAKAVAIQQGYDPK